MIVYLIRHAEQDETQCLTKLGYEQARKLGEFLRHKGVEVVFSSDRTRARETAQVVSKILGRPQIVLYDLEEVGEVKIGESADEAKERAFQGILRALRGRREPVVAFILHSKLIRHFLARIGYEQYLPEEFGLAHTGIVKLELHPSAIEGVEPRFDLLEYNLTP